MINQFHKINFRIKRFHSIPNPLGRLTKAIEPDAIDLTIDLIYKSLIKYYDIHGLNLPMHSNLIRYFYEV
jgi:hypothetical protein